MFPTLLCTSLFTSASVNSTPFHIHPRYFILLVLFHLLILLASYLPTEQLFGRLPPPCLRFLPTILYLEIYIILDFSNFSDDRQINELLSFFYALRVSKLNKFFLFPVPRLRLEILNFQLSWKTENII